MIRIDFSKIFRIAEDAIYYDGGKISFSDILEKDGYHGEEKLADGEFVIELNGTEKIMIAFPFSSFGQGQSAIANARAMCGSVSLFLKQVGVIIKTL